MAVRNVQARCPSRAEHHPCFPLGLGTRGTVGSGPDSAVSSVASVLGLFEHGTLCVSELRTDCISFRHDIDVNL